MKFILELTQNREAVSLHRISTPIIIRSFLILSFLSTMSKANYNPLSLSGNPQKALVPPGKCQFTEEFRSVPLLERVRVSKTSHVLRFGLPDSDQPLNLSTCACILAKANIEGEDVIRP